MIPSTEEVDEDVGVINPFAMIEKKMAERNVKLPNWRVMEEEEIVEVFENELGIPYKNLFDPIHKSPLYPWTEREELS